MGQRLSGFLRPEAGALMPFPRKIIHGLMCFALLGPAAAQETSWEELVAAGQSAFQAGRFQEAEEKFGAALRIAEDFSELDTRLATTLNNIAAVYYINGDYVAAEPLFRRALSIREQSLGRDHLEVATSLNNLAAVYRKQGDLTTAAPALQRALGIRQSALGSSHPGTLAILDNLAAVHRGLGQDAQAETLLKQSLDGRRAAGTNDSEAEAVILEQLADIQRDQGRFGEAVESLDEAVALKRQLGVDTSGLETQIVAMRDMLRGADAVVAVAPPVRFQALTQVLVPQTPIITAVPEDDLPAGPIVDMEPKEPTAALAALPVTPKHAEEAPTAATEHGVMATASPRVSGSTVDGESPKGEITATGFFLQLVSLQSEERAAAEWPRLQDDFAGALGDVAAEVVRADLGDHGVWYRLQAGPFEDFDRAEALCAALAESDQACLVVQR